MQALLPMVSLSMSPKCRCGGDDSWSEIDVGAGEHIVMGDTGGVASIADAIGVLCLEV